MTAHPKPLEGKIRFTTRNAWDDPTFRVAIKGDERAKRRAEMQATIDLEESRRAGTWKDKPEALPVAAEAPAPPKKTPELARDPKRPQYLAAPWVCPGCKSVYNTANAVRAHKAECVGLYERRRDAEAGVAKPGPAYRCPECGLGATSQASLRGHRLAEHKEAVAAAVAKVDALLADPKTVVVTDFNDEPEAEAPPVAREPIQADTPVEAPACPIGEPAPATVAAEEGEKEMAAKTKTVRPCGCGGDGRHRSACALAKKTTPTPVTCECGKPFPSETARNGHLKHCLKRKGSKGAAPAKKTPKAPAAPSPEAPASDDGPGDHMIHDAVLRAFPERAGKIENARHYAEAVRDMSFALLRARGDAMLRALEPSAPAPSEPEPPSLRCLVVRVRGAVPLEVECATPEDAAAFVRLVSAGGVS